MTNRFRKCYLWKKMSDFKKKEILTGGSTPDLRNLGHSLPNAKSLREHLLSGGKSDFHSSPSKPTTSHLSQQEAFIQRLKEENAQLKREAAAREAKLQGLRP